MKKTWENATIETLEVAATAGGTINNQQVDSEIYWNEEKGTWSQDLGTGTLSD